MLRQALVNTVSTAIAHLPQQLHLETRTEQARISILVQAVAQRESAPRQASADDESVEMAKQLVQLCPGSMSVTTQPGDRVFFEARIELEAAEQVTVLVVDDNQDALQLFQRYLSGSRYRFVGAHGAQSGLDSVAETEPQIIVLDVMMPEQDGWSLLGQFRENPRLEGVPIIVCTILPQEQLARTLGAADFIRKPVSRAQFLATLDRRLEQLSRAPC
jgi:CheY-like chemotaxis protein